MNKITLKNDPEQPQIIAHIWDTAGSERYRSVASSHFRSAVGALLVFDISSSNSFKMLDYWLDKLRQSADPRCQVVLMANKCDLEESQREVRTEQIN